MASDKLKNYLKELAQNAAVRHAHLIDAEASMKKAKLSKKHRDMINTGDVEAIQKELGSKSCYLIVASNTHNHFKKKKE